ncbi:MAG: alpha-hydroxy acid oxidase [Hyphomicrobiaceae bacterium]
MSDFAVNIQDLRRRARRRLPKPIFDFLDGGAQDETTLAANRADFAGIRFLPRMLVDMRDRKQAARVLGQEFDLPLILAPTGLTGAFWPGGEIVAAQAAKTRGLGYCLSTNATTSIEELAPHHTGFWFQLYPLKDRGVMQGLIERAAKAGASVLCLTVDLAAAGQRERDLRNGFTVPPRFTPGNVFSYAVRPGWLWRLARGPKLTFANFNDLAARGLTFMSLARYAAAQYDPGLNWNDIGRIKEMWRGKLALKGILSPDDARRAVDAGADAVIVSNHGGRQLDGAPSAIRALGPIAEAVGDRIEVLMDSGIRRGADVVKALALGARACLIGRAFLYGLAAGGPAGVARAIDILIGEIDNVQTLIGCPDLARIDRSFLAVGDRKIPIADDR